MPARHHKHALRRREAVNVFEAFRQVVYLHGVEKLAPLMGLRPGTLYNKADAGDDSHNQPSLRDVVMLTQITGDMRVLDSLNESFDRASFDCSTQQAASDEALLQLLAELGSQAGEFHTALADGLREQKFTTQRMEVIRAEGMDIVAALMTLMHRLEGLVDE